MRSGRCGSLSCWALFGFLFWAGCSDKEQAPSTPADTWDGYCVDQDGDGYGFQCEKGEDCDDVDPKVFEGCKACSTPNQDCDCEANAAPVDCTVSKQVVEGSLLCSTGTRYCRDGKWSACEGVKTFEAPPPSHLLTRSLIDPDAGAVACSACRPDCYQIEDLLTPTGDGGLVPGENGGITLRSVIVGGDAAVYPDTGLLDDNTCIPGTAPDFDCDGIPDAFDPLPGSAPFSSDHDTIFMDLGPGDQKEETFEVRFYLNTADIYLYIDMTGSMGGEQANLLSSLRNGNFLANSGVGLDCADRNFNGSSTDEEHLKNEGVAGNLACLIRDSHLGTGWHRDLPFPRRDPTGFAFGPHDFEAFEHSQDLTSNVTDVFNSLNTFSVRGGINRPEGGIMGLYSIATGAELYVGWNRPGNPARTGCPTGTWGYPCFRDDAVPIVIWMTDAPITNGPAPAENRFEAAYNEYGVSTNQPVNWDPSALIMETGSDSTYHSVDRTNEALSSALDLGDINNSFITYVGNTTGMLSDINYGTLLGSSSTSVLASAACSTGSAWSSSAQTAPDAVFKFKVTQAEPITISTRGSRLDTALAILPVNLTSVATTTLNGSVVPSTAPSLGTLSLPGGALVTGTTSGAGYFSRDAVGCLASNTGSSDLVAASVVKFNLASTTPTLRLTSDMNGSLATAVFAGRPATFTAPDVDLAAMTVTVGTDTRLGNASDDINTYDLGNMTGAYRRLINGTTNDGDLTENYASTVFSGFGGTCNNVSRSTEDAVFDFSVSASTRIRIEGAGNNDSLEAGFEHTIGLIKRTKVPHTGLTTNVSDATAQTIIFSEIPADTYSWTQYDGTLGGAADTYLQSEVGPFATSTSATACTYGTPATNGTQQGVFLLDIPTGTASASYQFDTGGSSTHTWLSLHQDIVDTQLSVASTNNGGAADVQSLGALDERSVFVTGATLTDATADVLTSRMGCAATGVLGGKDAVFTFSTTAAQTVQVSTGISTGNPLAVGVPAFDSQIAVFSGSLAGTRVAGSCTNPSGNAFDTGTFNTTAGVTYYVVVKDFGAVASPGAYGLWVRDTSFSTHVLQCDYGSQANASSNRAAKLTRTLGPGRYYIVVKGTGGAAYQLRVRRPVTGAPTLHACDVASGGNTYHSVIDTTLAAGNYSLIIHGYGRNDRGTYNLIFRDLGIAPRQVACGYDANGTTPTPLTLSNLPARDAGGNLIDYYAVMRGNTSAGQYSIRINDGTTVTNGARCVRDNVSMTLTNSSPSYTETTDINNAEWTGTLPVGDYYAVLKGYDDQDSNTTDEDNDYGQYQLSIGDQTNFQRSGTFAAKRWLGPAGDGVGGVLKALTDRKLRVIMVDSTTGSGDSAFYSDQQMRTIASATGAVASDGSPLFFKINQDGTGLGATIVSAVNTLAGNLAMDVGVRFVDAPDSTAPARFIFRAQAIDVPGDLCQPPIDTDGDAQHLPDTHVRCTPGAVPRFKISLTNPSPPNNVPTNPRDPNGGYHMRIELIGDGQYVVDTIPVYIIPADVVEDPGDLRFEATATYEATIPASGCVGTEAPVWQELRWAATVPADTLLTFNVCTADTAALLASCTPQLAATVQTGNACLTDSNCPNGFCNPDSVCEFRMGGACTADLDCGVGGTCVANRCMWRGNVDVKPALLRSMQGKDYARVQILMQSNPARSRAPTVNSWNLNYTCTAQE